MWKDANREYLERVLGESVMKSNLSVNGIYTVCEVLSEWECNDYPREVLEQTPYVGLPDSKGFSYKDFTTFGARLMVLNGDTVIHLFNGNQNTVTLQGINGFNRSYLGAYAVLESVCSIYGDTWGTILILSSGIERQVS